MPPARHDYNAIADCLKWMVSTHMPLARHDSPIVPDVSGQFGFYSHASYEAWPGSCRFPVNGSSFYSHASCEAWQADVPSVIMLDVSTHMPLARHDLRQFVCYLIAMFLLTCLLRGMTVKLSPAQTTKMFLLTCLLRGMTTLTLKKRLLMRSFYSHASCEAWRRLDL